MHSSLLPLALSFFVLCVFARSLPKSEIKQLAGPPSEFAFYQQPDPKVGAMTSSSAWIPVVLDQVIESGKIVWVWKGSLPVDSDSKFSLSVFCPQRNDLLIYAQPPQWPMTLLDDSIFNAEGAKGQKVEHEFGIGETKMMVTTFIFPEPVVGTWNFEVKSNVEIKHKSGMPHLYLLLGNESPIKVTTNLNTYDLQQGQEVGLVARVFDLSSSPNVVNPLLEGDFQPMQDIIFEADMDVIFPDGKDVLVHMKDDGVGADLQANDGVYSAVLEAAEVGEYIAYSTIKGRTPAGVEFMRTNVHAFAIVGPDVTLTGLATAHYETEREDVLMFLIDVDTILQDTDELVRGYAEVWGTDETGLEYVPVAWMQAMTAVTRREDNGKQVIALELHKNWIQMAKARPPFQLRKVEISDPQTSVPFSQRDVIYVEMEQKDASKLLTDIDYSLPVVITEEMQMGPRPQRLRKPASNVLAENGNVVQTPQRKILLIHGYCANVNEFPPSEFDNSVQFQDFGKSRSNQEFALKIREFAEQFPEGVTSVAHSQGGLASLHLHAYFWSNLEVPVTDGGRLIQSVGSPYQGTTLAGILADLGWVFGIGCGSNNDLTRDGAANWLSKVPTTARNDVYYYTTQYDEYWWILPNDCVTAANVVLSKPNDGTTEEYYGQLAGGHAAGHKKNWCHTTGMKYPPQCTDAERNAEMNRFAAKH